MTPGDPPVTPGHPRTGRAPSRINYGDRRHWEVELGRFTLKRWCTGDRPPCRNPADHKGRGHLISVVVYRRTGSARFDEFPRD